MELISREAAIAAMKKATKEVGFNPFKVLNEVPEAEAVTMDELQAAFVDMNTHCRGNTCSKCDYAKARVCSNEVPEDADAGEFILAYRRRKEEGKC